MIIYFSNKIVFSTSSIPDTMLGNEDIDSGVGRGWWATKGRGKKTERSEEEEKLDEQRALLAEGQRVQRRGSTK